jgi:DNA-binding NarL/FixJ family response regulator
MKPAKSAQPAVPLKPRVLFVDDDSRFLKSLQRALSFKCGEWDMVFSNSGKQALALIEQAACDVIVADLHMPGMNGVELLEQVRLHHPQAIRLLLTGQLGDNLAVASLEVAQLYFCKPCDPGLLISSVESVLESCGQQQGVFEVCSE